MPKATRSQFGKILSEVTRDRNAASYAVNQENKKAIIKAGGKVRTLTATQRAAWVKALKPVWDKFEKDVGADAIADAQKANAGS